MQISDLTVDHGVLFRLLGRLWFRELDKTLLRSLMESPIREAFLEAGGYLPDDDSESTLDDLSADYCRLFIGPRHHFPPVQSVWQAGQLQGQASDSMKDYLEVVQGLADWASTSTLFDHLGVQLEVAGVLLQSTGASASEKEQRAFVDRFFVNHLAWPKPLLAAARQNAETDFYRGLMDITHELLCE